MSRLQSKQQKFKTAYDVLCGSMPTAWHADFGDQTTNDRNKQAVSALRAISISVVCGQHFLLHINQDQYQSNKSTSNTSNASSYSSPSTTPSTSSVSSNAEMKSDHAKDVDLIVNVVRGHANVSNGIAHLVFTSETTCEQLMQIAKQGQIFIAIDVHLATSRVLRALSEIMSLRATPVVDAGNNTTNNNNNTNNFNNINNINNINNTVVPLRFGIRLVL